jgi:hypothetical protein
MRLRLLLVGALTTAAAVVLAAPPAGATVSGPCRGALNGTDVAPLSTSDPNDAIKVDKNDEIVTNASSSAPIDSYRIELEYAGIRWKIADGTVNSTSWTKTVKVKKYARYGVGLYRVHAVSNGAAKCEGSALVEVKGSPFTSVAGIVGTVLVAIAVANAAYAAVRAARAGSQRIAPEYAPRTAP